MRIELSPLCYGLGYAAGLAAFLWMAHRRKLSTDGVRSVMIAGLIGGLAAANLGQWLFAHSAGKTVLAGIAGGYLTVVLYKRRLGLTRPLGDLFAVAICAGEAVGRWGCFFGGCCYGRPTGVPWAVFQHGQFRHPTQLYLSFACVLILLALWAYERRHPPENGLFYLQGLLYCAARFLVEFYRYNDTLIGGLSVAQWACILGMGFFGFRLYTLLHQPINKPLLGSS